MRILVAIGTMRAGGTERVVSVLANAWAADGHDVRIMIWGDGSEVPHYPVAESISIVPLMLFTQGPRFLAPLRLLKRIIRIRRAIKVTSPDVVFSFGERTNAMFIFSALWSKIPVIASERIAPELHFQTVGPVWSIVARVAYLFSNRMVVPVSAVGEALKRWLVRPPVVIPNPVPQPPAVDAPPPALQPYVLAVGRLTYQKGIDLLVAAFGDIASEFPGWRLVVVGDGATRQALATQANASGIGDRVIFSGVRSDVERWLAHADLFVLPSRFEAFPNALAEAMASGCAVIAADCRYGPRDLVHQDVDGVLVPPENVSALAQAMRRLMSDPALRDRLGSSARQIVQRFSVQRVQRMWIDLANQVRLEFKRRA